MNNFVLFAAVLSLVRAQSADNGSLDNNPAIDSLFSQYMAASGSSAEAYLYSQLAATANAITPGGASEIFADTPATVTSAAGDGGSANSVQTSLQTVLSTVDGGASQSVPSALDTAGEPGLEGVTAASSPVSTSAAVGAPIGAVPGTTGADTNIATVEATVTTTGANSAGLATQQTEITSLATSVITSIPAYNGTFNNTQGTIKPSDVASVSVGSGIITDTSVVGVGANPTGAPITNGTTNATANPSEALPLTGSQPAPLAIGGSSVPLDQQGTAAPLAVNFAQAGAVNGALLVGAFLAAII